MGATGCNREEAEKHLNAADANLRRIAGHFGTGRE
jgi:hypothetical protein